MRRFWLLILLLLVTACESSDKKNTVSPVQGNDNAQLETAWRPASERITGENAFQLQLVGVLNGHRGTVFETTLNDNSQRYVTLGGDEQTVVWNLASGRSVASLQDAELRAIQFLVDDETYLALDGKNNLSKRSVVDTESVQQIPAHEQRYSAWAISPDETLVAVGGIDGIVNLYRLATLEPVTNFIAHHGGFAIDALYFSPSGNILYTVGADEIIRSWNTTTWDIISELEDNALSLFGTATTPDGTKLAVARAERMNIYDTNTGELLTTFDIPTFSAISVMKFSSDGAWLAMGGNIDSVVIFDISTGDMVIALPGHSDDFVDLAFSESHDLIVTGLGGGNAFLWDLRGLLAGNPDSQQVQIPKAVLQQVKGLQLHKVDWTTDGTKIMLIDRRGPIYVLGIPE